MLINYTLVTSDKTHIRQIKCILEEQNLLSKKCKISQVNNEYYIPINTDLSPTEVSLLITYPHKLLLDDENPSNVLETTNSFESIIKKNIFDDYKPKNASILIKSLPKRFSIYPPLLLLPNNTLDSREWEEYINSISKCVQKKLFEIFIEFFKKNLSKSETLTHIAINKPIVIEGNDLNIVRKPNHLLPIYGDFGPKGNENFELEFWCHVIQNGIYQTWAPRHTMFSRGNIKEKARILNTFIDIRGNSIVDLYAGIGYFTLSYLNCGAKRLFCWEINEWSVEGLKRGVEKNGWGNIYIIRRNEKIDLEKVLKTKCVCFLESNEFAMERFEEMNEIISKEISHINLGLLPSSKDSWGIASQIANRLGRDDGCWIHVHENIGVTELNDFMKITKKEFEKWINGKVEDIWLEKVKTFAPDVYHIVGDFRVYNIQSKN